VKTRKKRVVKYGHTQESSLSFHPTQNNAGGNSTYALFDDFPKSTYNPSTSTSDLRRRKDATDSSSSSMSSNNNNSNSSSYVGHTKKGNPSMQSLVQTMKPPSTQSSSIARSQNAEKIEASIAQVSSFVHITLWTLCRQ